MEIKSKSNEKKGLVYVRKDMIKGDVWILENNNSNWSTKMSVQCIWCSVLLQMHSKLDTAVEMASKWSPIPYFGGRNNEQRFWSLLAVNFQIFKKIKYFDEPLERYWCRDHLFLQVIISIFSY